MKEFNANKEIKKIIQINPQEGFDKGFNPIEDLVCELEYDSEYISNTKDNDFSRIFEEDDLIEQYENYKERRRWEYRCHLREKMAPDFYASYFLPFFDSTLREVYDKDLTEELEFYKPPFEEWIFMILAVMTEYYFREKYPFTYDRLNWFNLSLHRGKFKSEIYRRYNAVTW